jgi:hypothetical protein
MPRCPICSHDGRHDLNTGPLGGLICGACGSQFTTAPGEYEANAARRAVWAEVTRDRQPRPRERGGKRLMGRRQKGKGSKRRKSWHRGHGEARRCADIEGAWPELDTDAGPVPSAPVPLRRDSGPSRLHWDTA